MKKALAALLLVSFFSPGRAGTAAAAPAISLIGTPPGSVHVYEKYEVKFNVTTMSQYPFFQYDPSPPPGVTPGVGITVEGVFTSPSGKVLRQPAFYMTEVNRVGSGETMRFEETNNKYWAVRFSPLEQGSYQVSLTARDASGTTLSNVGSFTALAPIRKGFVRVSGQDGRYFEFSNGDLFWPIGPAWLRGNDYTKYRDTGQNFDRLWMAGFGAYSTNFARWKSSGEAFGNEGLTTRLSWREKAPGSELSYEIFYGITYNNLNAHRMWLTTWLDDMFGPRLVTGRKYFVKLTYKTSGITGPRTSGVPYGFAVKTSDYVPWGDPDPSTFDNSMRAAAGTQIIVNHITTSDDWRTITTTFVPAGDRQNIYLYMDNVTGGAAYVDVFSMKECLDTNCTSLGGEVIRNPKADQHTYVEQRPAAFFDWQLEQGEANGVFFKYVVHDKNDWIQNHLNIAGQWVDASQGDGYYQPENTKARWLLRQWYRYLVARYGYSTALHSWELNNEGPPNEDPPGSGTAPHWETAQAFARFLHDVNQNGDTADEMRRQLASTSFWCCWRPAFWGNNTRFADIDYADIHEYSNNPQVAPANYTNDMAMLISSVGIETVDGDESYEPANKPVILGETGLAGADWAPLSELRNPNPGIWYHNLLWAQLNQSGMSAPGYWFAEHVDDVITRTLGALRGKEAISKPFYEFVRTLDLNRGGYGNVSATSSNSKLRVIGQKNASRGTAHLWIQNADHTWRNVMGTNNPTPILPQSGTVTLRMSPSTDYEIQWWDTYQGTVSRTEVVRSTASGDITLSISNLADDVAVKIERAGSAQPTFADVPFSYPYHDDIEALYQGGYTAGCSTGPLMYCPEQAMNRAESAVFVERGIHTAAYDPPAPSSQVFADVPLDSWAVKWVNGLWVDQYTAGCGTNPLIYCPWQGHTRAEGAVFYLRMLNGYDYSPARPSQPIFADVPLDSWYSGWVEAAYQADLIPPCATLPEMRFCPNDPLTRAMAAHMMVRAKGLRNPELAGGVVATFEVHSERFEIWVTNPQTIQQLFSLGIPQTKSGFPSGPILRGSGQGGRNFPWSWHLDPDATVITPASIELCDGVPSYVETHVDEFVDHIGAYCPWAARLIRLEDFR